MKYIKFNNVDLSKIALGSADLGTAVNKEDSFKLLDYYFSHGGNIVDTGRVYCSWLKDGANKSESTLGEYIKINNIRNKVIICTKGGHPPIEDMSKSRINEKEIEKDLNESLKYLQTSYIDVYYLHRDDETKPVSEIMTFLNKFVKEGKIRFLGASNWKMARILEANAYARKNGLTPFTFSEIQWSYARLNEEGKYDKSLVYMNKEEYEQYKKSDIILMAFSSQAQGFFSKLDNGVSSLNDITKEKFLNDINLERYELIKEIKKDSDLSSTAIGLNALICNKDIKVIPIVGGFSLPLLEDSLKATDLNKKLASKLLDEFTY